MKITQNLIPCLLCLSLAWLPLQAQDEVPELASPPANNTTVKPAPAPVEVKRLPRLTVKVAGLAPETGSVEVSLFNSAETFMLEPFFQESGVPDKDGNVEVLFLNVFEGEYGVVVVHDENANSLYDAGFLGFGAEPVGYSNDAAPWLGRPSFEDVSFDVQESMEISINMN